MLIKVHKCCAAFLQRKPRKVFKRHLLAETESASRSAGKSADKALFCLYEDIYIIYLFYLELFLFLISFVIYIYILLFSR